MKKQDFNSGWLFCKQGADEKQPVRLPHDAMLAEARDPQSPGGSACAFFNGGVYEYEKTFTAPAGWAHKHMVFEFEGVYKNSRVFINGKEAGGAAYGYTPFFVCADGLLQEGENTLRVVADNSQQPNSRWYSGGGIYRPVWLWVGGQTHIPPEGLRVTTLSINPVRIRVETGCTKGEGVIEIFDGARQVAQAQGLCAELEVPAARLWSDETPHLYTCRVTLREGGQIQDVAETAFGVRTLEWSPKGLFVNGKETLLRGGCVHHDSGILGAATCAESEWRRVRLLKQAGFNAIRSSHNPASKAMLEACDALGVYLMDETWDMWYSHKNKFDYATDFLAGYKADLEALVARDYNHPSVIMYSIGNEVSEPAQPKGVELAKEMVGHLHGLDATRPVTGGINLMIISRSAKGNAIYKEEGGMNDTKQEKMGGMNSTMFNLITSMVGTGMNKGANSKQADAITSPVLDALDIAGYNYASGRYPLEGKAHPNRLIFGSETFPQDIAKNWAMVKQYPYLIGDFMWTAWDYLGEAGIGAWAYTPDGKGFEKPYPWLLADVGAIDILGNPNGELFLAQAAWGLLKAPAIAVQPVNHPGVRPAKGVWRGTNGLPSWAWQGCQGNRAVVEVYTGGAVAELFLGSKSLGKKRVKGCKAAFKTQYAPGVLTAVAYDANGRELGRQSLASASGPVAPRLLPEAETAKPGQLVYLPVVLADEAGVVESNGDEAVTVTVTGGELLAFGSANPRTEERYQSGCFTTYYGRALAVVRAGQAGAVTVTATAKSGAATVSITITE